MKAVMLGVLTVAGLVMAAWGATPGRREVPAPSPPLLHQAGAGNELIAVPGPTGEKGQLLTVIDPKTRVMSVYHIESATGKIALRSVRNIHWDLQMTEFNGERPLPQEIRSLLEQR